MFFGIRLDLGNASDHRPLKILFQHRPDRPCQARIGTDGEVQGAYLPLLNERTKRGQRCTVTTISISNRVVAFFGRAECPLHRRVVVEQREEDRDAFDDAGSPVWLDPSPVIVKPALDSFKPLPTFLVRFIFGRTLRAALTLDVAGNSLCIQNSSQLIRLTTKLTRFRLSTARLTTRSSTGLC